jgi:hypothetical protein
MRIKLTEPPYPLVWFDVNKDFFCFKLSEDEEVKYTRKFLYKDLETNGIWIEENDCKRIKARIREIRTARIF